MTEKEVIEIDMSDFIECGSKRLLRDLAKNPEGVSLDIKKYGKNQPQNLKRMLMRNRKEKASVSDRPPIQF